MIAEQVTDKRCSNGQKNMHDRLSDFETLNSLLNDLVLDTEIRGSRDLVIAHLIRVEKLFIGPQGWDAYHMMIQFLPPQVQLAHADIMAAHGKTPFVGTF